MDESGCPGDNKVSSSRRLGTRVLVRQLLLVSAYGTKTFSFVQTQSRTSTVRYLITGHGFPPP
eukprot:scaffold112743_cov31-Prasinocladus_malaysianus.AAC.1